MEEKPDLTLAGYDPFRDSEGFYYDSTVIERIEAFARTHLVHVKGKWAGKPFELAHWQRIWLANLFGWKHSDGEYKDLRRYRSGVLEIGRKAGKTFVQSLLSWWMLACDGEQGAEIILGANSIEQASKLFEVLEGQWKASKVLQQRFKLLSSRRRILYPATNSYLQVVSADGTNCHGANIHYGCLDEYHGATNNKLYEAIATGSGSRDQSLFIVTSTSGNDKQSPFYQLHDYAEKVRDGIVKDATFFPCIFSVPKELWDQEEHWPLANPSLPYGTPSLNFLRGELKKAKAIPAYENSFKQLYCCIWTEQKTRWLPVDQWNKCVSEYPDELNFIPAFAGLDLSTNRDITAFVITWLVNNKIHAESHFFTTTKNAENREENQRIPYQAWQKNLNNNLHVHDGEVIDLDQVTETILSLCEKYDIRAIYFDRYKHSSVTSRLTQQGIECIAHGQGAAHMTTPCHELERLILSDPPLLNHGGNEILTWMAGNVEVENDGTLMRPVKPDYHNEKKIDGISALLMSLSGHIGNEVNFNPNPVITNNHV